MIGSVVIGQLFVYGTLRPGDVRWPMLAPFVLGDGVDDGVIGQVYDTGCGYPAAIFGVGEVSIIGRRYALAPDRVERALEVLDVEEASVAGLYRRVAVVTVGGVDAWAYEYVAGHDLTPIASNDWLAR